MTFTAASSSEFRAPQWSLINRAQTVEAWFKTTSSGVIIGMSNDTAATGTPTHWTPAVYVGSDGLLRGGFWTYTGFPGMVSTTTVTDGAWHHVMLVASTTYQSLYLDGNQIGVTNAGVDNQDMYEVRVGRGYTNSWTGGNGGWLGFNGQIDEVSIYPYPLSVARVQAHYKAAKLGVLTSGSHKIRIDYQDLGGNASLNLYSGGIGSTTPVAASSLTPGYGLVTSTTDADGKSTGYEYQYPELGLQTATIADPGSLALRTETTYEPAGTGPTAGLRRQTGRKLPATAGTGTNTNTFTYYTAGVAPWTSTNAAETANNPCPVGGTGIIQGGAAKTKTTITAGDGSAQSEAFVYFGNGLLAASKKNSESGWTCFDYDARGRVTSKSIPAFGTAPARTVTYNYAVGGDPTVTTVSDNSTSSVASNPTITTTTDWLGRTLTYTDALGKVTTTSYDDPSGRVASTVGPSGYGTVTQAYDSAWRPTTTSIGGAAIATVGYDSGSGLPTSVTYPSTGGGIGNGATVTTGYDLRGRTASLTWTGPGSTALTSDTVTRSLAGRISDEAFDGTIGGAGDANTPGDNYLYDGAGRLTQGYVQGHHFTYDFATAPTSADCPTGSLVANKNSNRTSTLDQPTSGSAVTTKYCYDAADRLLKSTDASIGTNVAYDPRGRTTTLGGDTYAYDSSDRHASTATGGGTTTTTVAAPTVVATSKVQAGSGTSSWTVPKPTGLAVGDVLVVAVTHDASLSSYSPSGWNFVDYEGNWSVSPAMVIETYTKVADALDVAGTGWTFGLSGSPSNTSTSVATAVRGVDTTGASPWTDGAYSSAGTGGRNSSSSSSGSATSLSVGAVTSTQVNDLALTFVASNANGVTFTPASGYTEQQDTSYSTGRNVEVAAKTLTAAGSSGSPSVTASTGTGLSGVHVIFKGITTTTTTGGSTVTAPTVVSTSKVQAGSGTSSWTVPKPTGLAVGDVVVVAVTHDASLSSYGPSGWNYTDYEGNWSVSPGMVIETYTKKADSTDVAGTGWTFGLSGSPSNTSTSTAIAVRGADTTGATPYSDGAYSSAGTGGRNSSSSSSGTATSLAIGQVTSTQANDLSVTITSSNVNGVTFTPGSGYTEQQDTSYGTGRNLEIATKTLTTAGASGSPTVTSSAGTGLSAIHLTLKGITTGGATTTVGYVRDPQDRIIARTLNGTVTGCYVFTGSGDTPDQTLAGSGTSCSATVAETTYGLPGGVTVTKRGASSTDVWALTNLHGDIAAVTNGAGVKQGATLLYAPDGNPLGGLPDDAAGNFDAGWEGSHQKYLEHETGLQPTIEMGARPYNTLIGRFLETAPILGGTPNDYSYAQDPINQSDLTGTIVPDSQKCNVSKQFKKEHKQYCANLQKHTGFGWIGKHWRGALQVASIAAAIGCVAVTEGAMAPVCLKISIAVSSLSTAVSAYDNVLKPKQKCLGNFVRDAGVNLFSAGIGPYIWGGSTLLEGGTAASGPSVRAFGNGLGAAGTVGSTSASSASFCSGA